MNLANRLSMFRVVVLPVFLPLLWIEWFVPAEDHLMLAIGHIATLLLVIAVAVSDYWDGKVARDLGLVSNVGKMLDPLTDKIFMAGALVGLAQLGHIPAWIVIVVLAREFLITGLRSIAADQGRMIPADRLGKHKTGWQFGFVITALTWMSLRQALMLGGAWEEAVDRYSLDRVLDALLWIPILATLGLTVISGWQYISKNADLLD